jgi:hypothetical protein
VSLGVREKGRVEARVGVKVSHVVSLHQKHCEGWNTACVCVCVRVCAFVCVCVCVCVISSTVQCSTCLVVCIGLSQHLPWRVGLGL